MVQLKKKNIKPETYYLSYGVYPEPILVEPGETIATKLPDAHGFDENMQSAAGSPNPLVGPFVIPDASPGNALAITIESFAPNRSRGWASRDIHPNLRYPADRAVRYPKEYVEWGIDLERNITYPLGEYFTDQQVEMPIQPVLGCIDVAPDSKDPIPSIMSGAFGGNMDFPKMTLGATIYLPIFVEGAYLFLGDGHAVQGAGEITGNGVEVFCDITFTVRLANMKMLWPRGENETHIFCMGNTAPLEDACRIATGEMEKWLGSRYQLSKDQVGIIMGQMVDYNIGNLVSQYYSVGCIMPQQFQ